jgi:hypothetical protein
MRVRSWIGVAVLLAGVSSAAEVGPASGKPSPWANKPTAVEEAPAPQPELVIPQGTVLRVRIDQSVDTRRNRPGNRFQATLAEPVLRKDAILLPRGTRFAGHVMESKPSGRLKGRAVLSLTLDSFRANGREYQVNTGGTTRVSGRHKKRNLVLIGGGAGTGAGIGAIAAGGFGALIGAAAGGVAGTATAVFTGKKNVGVPAETLLAFPLRSSVRL